MKLCLIGDRGHVNYVFQSLAEVPEVKIAGVSMGCQDSPDSLLTRCAEAGFCPPVFDDWRAMLDKVQPDLVCVCGPFEAHAEMCAECMRRGVHVFCEKPVAIDLESFAELERVYQRERIKDARFVSMVGMRYEPAFYTAYEMVRDGAIGRIKLMDARKSYRFGNWRPDYYRTRKTYGGTIPWVGSHALDWILHFTGQSVERFNAYQTRADNFGYGDLEVAAVCQMVTTGGVLASVTMDFLRPEKAPTHGDDRLRLVGTAGVLEIREEVIHLIDGDGPRTIIPPAPPRKLFSDFALELLGGRPALVSDRDTLELTRLCLLVQQNADQAATLA